MRTSRSRSLPSRRSFRAADPKTRSFMPKRYRLGATTSRAATPVSSVSSGARSAREPIEDRSVVLDHSAEAVSKRLVLASLIDVCVQAVPMRLLAGGSEEAVEVRSVAALDSLLQLRVRVHRHLRVGVPDLTHDPLHVEVVGQEGDRDVGPAEAVRRQTARLTAWHYKDLASPGVKSFRPTANGREQRADPPRWLAAQGRE